LDTWDEQVEEALRIWLLDRLESYFDFDGRMDDEGQPTSQIDPGLVSVALLADVAGRDDAFHEAHFWNQSEFSYAQNSDVRSGSGAFVLRRDATHSNYAATWLRNRITFEEDRDLTVHGYLKGGNAGRVEIAVRWFIRNERTVISTTVEY